MKALKRTAIILALGLAAGGCSVMEYKSVAREDLKNAQGHVVGFKEMVRDARTGEEVTQISLYVPRLDSRGTIVGYEERVRDGAILHDLDGKRIGTRWNDVRSRANNPQSKGLVITVRAKQSATVAQAPSIDELVQLARLTN